MLTKETYDLIMDKVNEVGWQKAGEHFDIVIQELKALVAEYERNQRA